MRGTGCHMEPVRTPLGIVDSSVSLPYKISYKTIDSTMHRKEVLVFSMQLSCQLSEKGLLQTRRQ